MPQNLVADIGGTNTRISLSEGPLLLADSARKYANRDFESLEAAIADYLKAQGIARCAGACAAVAGPVTEEGARLTNLDWRIDRETLAGSTGAEHVEILNDLQAQGHALDAIAPESLSGLKPGEKKPGGARLVIGIGTGFNAAPVLRSPAGPLVAASECGHVSLPFASGEDAELFKSAAGESGFASVEEILSGRGLERVYAWLSGGEGPGGAPSSREIISRLEAGESTARRALGKFTRVLGAVSGDLALTHLPFGGIFLIGGMSRIVHEHADRMDFAEPFHDKGRFSDFMRRFCVETVTDDFAALAGCAARLWSLMHPAGSSRAEAV